MLTIPLIINYILYRNTNSSKQCYMNFVIKRKFLDADTIHTIHLCGGQFTFETFIVLT